MPITKTGNALVNGLKAVGSMVGPGYMMGQVAYDFASGNESFGGALGGLAGGTVGFSLSNKLFRKLPEVKFLTNPLTTIGSLAAGLVGDSLGRSVGNAIAPWQRGRGVKAQSLIGGSQNFPPQPYEGQNVQIG